jgi:transposase
MPQFTVALDLGKWKHAISIYDTRDNNLCQSMTIPVNQKGFAKLQAALAKYSTQPTDFLLGCEATGHYGETLLRCLQAKGYALVRLNPAQVTQFRRGLGRRAKTDELDADAMSRQLAVGDFVPDHPLGDTARMLRRVTRIRLDFVEEHGRWVNRLAAVVNQMFPEVEPLLNGLAKPTTLAILTAYPSRRRLAEAPLSELTDVVLRASRRNKDKAYALTLKTAATDSVGLDDPLLEMELQILLQQVSITGQSIRELDEQIKELTEQMLFERSEELGLVRTLRLKDFPVGSYLSIGTLLGEIGCVERFPTQKQLLSYFGWCPNTKESGTQKSPNPRLSRQGNRFARRIIWMLAVAAVRWVPEYRDYFQRRVDAGKNKMKTMVAVGRKLLCTIRAILLTGQAYDGKRYLSQSQKVVVT